MGVSAELRPKGGRAFAAGLNFAAVHDRSSKLPSREARDFRRVRLHKLDCFKLFLFDTGLLKAMAGVVNSAIMLKTDFQFKGQLAENYVLQQMKGCFAAEPHYYADKTGEIDFILQYGSDIIPVEVKAGTEKAAPSFKKYMREKSPQCAVRFSERGYMKNGEITNIPLYLAPRISDFL